MAFVIGGLGVYELFSEPFSFGTIRDVFIAGIFVYGLMKASHKIIDYNFIPAEDAARDTDDLEAYIASELIRERNSEDKENF